MKVKLIHLISVFAIVLLCSSCLFEEYSEPPCTGVSCNVQHMSNVLGEVGIEDSNNFWLHDIKGLSPTGHYKFMENDSGASLKYAIYGLIKGSYGYELRSKYVDDTSDGCCKGDLKYIIEDVVKIANEQVQYKPVDEGIEFYLQRGVKISAKLDDLDSVIINSKKETLSLSAKLSNDWETKYYDINVNDTGSSTTQIYHESIHLRGTTYHSVFEIIDNKASSQKVVPKVYYFSLTKGFMGYSLTNNELWLWQE